MKKIWIQSFTATLALLLAISASAQSLTKFESRPGSKMRMDGTSSIHDWYVESALVAGTLELDSAFLANPTAAKPGKIAAQVITSIPVRSLKSSSGKAMDDRMYTAMSMTKFPKIDYRLTELTLKETPKSAEGPYLFDSKGDLTVSGVTNKVSFPVTISRTDKSMKTTGSTAVKMTSFGIEPPGLILGIKTGDEIKLTFTWVTGQPEAK